MNNYTPNVSGGYGKTPPTRTFTDNNEIFMCIDWFTCTFDFIQFSYADSPPGSLQENEFKKGLEKLNQLYDLLKYPDVSERQFEHANINNYRHGYVTLGEFIKIWFGGAINKNNLYHNKLDMNGQACQDFIARGGNFYDLFVFFVNNGANFTRADAAIDVLTNKYFTIDKILEYAKNKSYVSPMRQGEYVFSWDSDDVSGETIYFGSKKHSNTLICIYDKKLEQFNKGIEIMDEAWIRVETRFKEQRANWFVSEFINNSENKNDFSFIAEALFAVLEFKEKTIEGKITNDTKRSRWDSAEWWLDFISVASKADFKSKVKIKPTLERKIDWVDRSVSKPLSQIYHNDPTEFITLIYELIHQKDKDFDNTDLSMINNYREKKGLKKLTMNDILRQQEQLSEIVKSLKGDDLDNEL